MNFALIGKDKTACELATAFLEVAIVVFACTVKYIALRYPNVGIGDTATDEAITNEVYKLIHK